MRLISSFSIKINLNNDLAVMILVANQYSFFF